MKVAKDILQELAYMYPNEQLEAFIVVKRDMIGQRRWVTEYEQILKHIATNTFYRTRFDLGSTEVQEDTEPYEYEPDELNLREVFPVEVSSIVYMEKLDA